MAYVAVGLGAVLGANLRYAISNWAAGRWGSDFPYGTLTVNVTGAFVIGLFLAAIAARSGLSPLVRLFFVTGFLGGYTTFSSYAWEALSLAQDGALLRFGIYVLGSNLVGLIGVWLGAGLGSMWA
jgi:fluoride exporter